MRKRPKKTAKLGGSAAISVVAGSSPSASTVSTKIPRPRQLLSTRKPPSDNLLSTKREEDRVDKQRKGAHLAFA